MFTHSSDKLFPSKRDWITPTTFIPFSTFLQQSSNENPKHFEIHSNTFHPQTLNTNLSTHLKTIILLYSTWVPFFYILQQKVILTLRLCPVHHTITGHLHTKGELISILSLPLIILLHSPYSPFLTSFMYTLKNKEDMTHPCLIPLQILNKFTLTIFYLHLLCITTSCWHTSCPERAKL